MPSESPADRGAAPEPTAPPPARRPGPRAVVLAILLPAVLLGGWRLAPLVLGQETLVLRDVLATHLVLEVAQAEGIRDGVVPLVDPLRSDQAAAGNPNGTPFYPTLLLHLVAPLHWVVNAHLWLHLVLAVPAAYALGRAWGVSRPGSWAGGVAYGVSGFAVSAAGMYANLAPAVALTPALVAAVLATVAAPDPGARRRRAALAGLLGALLLLGGDPLSALAAALLAAAAVAVRWATGRARERHPSEPDAPEPGRSAPRAGVDLAALGLLALAAGAALLVAAPQLVEAARSIPSSLRLTSPSAPVGAWHPIRALEAILPFPLGRPDLTGAGGFWGFRFHDGLMPLLFTLFPGHLTLALALAAGRGGGRGSRARAAARWGWLAVVGGLFFALGGYNPLLAPFLELVPGAGLRFSVKLHLAVAVGGAVLVGLGFDRVFGADRVFSVDRMDLGRLVRALALPAGATLAVAVLLVAAPALVEGWLRDGFTAAMPAAYAPVERGRLLATAIQCLVVDAGLLLALAWTRRRPVAGLATLWTVAVAGQLLLVGPVLTTDSMDFYGQPSPLAASLPAEARLVQGESSGLFPPARSTELVFPDRSMRWPMRRSHLELAPEGGMPFGIAYDMLPSPDDLDAWRFRLARTLTAREPSDGTRLRLLAHWGASHLAVVRPLVGDDAFPAPGQPGHPRLLARLPVDGRTARLHALDGVAPEVLLAEEVRRVEEPLEAWAAVRDPAFDPRREVVIEAVSEAPTPADGEALDGRASAEGVSEPGPAARVVARSPEHLEVEVTAPRGGVLVVNRSFLPLWRATVDGEAAPVVPANLWRLGVEVPPEARRVVLRVPRTSLVASGALAAFGFGLLLALAAAGARRTTPPLDGAAVAAAMMPGASERSRHENDEGRSDARRAPRRGRPEDPGAAGTGTEAHGG